MALTPDQEADRALIRDLKARGLCPQDIPEVPITLAEAISRAYDHRNQITASEEADHVGFILLGAAMLILIAIILKGAMA